MRENREEGYNQEGKFRNQLTGAAVSIFMKNVAVLAIALVHPIVKFVAELLARRPVAASPWNAEKDRQSQREGAYSYSCRDRGDETNERRRRNTEGIPRGLTATGSTCAPFHFFDDFGERRNLASKAPGKWNFFRRVVPPLRFAALRNTRVEKSSIPKKISLNEFLLVESAYRTKFNEKSLSWRISIES